MKRKNFTLRFYRGRDAQNISAKIFAAILLFFDLQKSQNSLKMGFWVKTPTQAVKALVNLSEEENHS